MIMIIYYNSFNLRERPLELSFIESTIHETSVMDTGLGLMLNDRHTRIYSMKGIKRIDILHLLLSRM